jgi:hypothetical protein
MSARRIRELENMGQVSEKGLPLGGIVLKAVLAPFFLRGPGLAVATITIDGAENVCAMLNVTGPNPAISSTAPQPRS